MSPEIKGLFTDYAELKEAIAEMEAKLDVLKPLLIPFIPEGSKIDTGTGMFSTGCRKVWQYSEQTTLKEAAVKSQKKEEEQTGIATSVNGEPFITYKRKK
jgi:hypothetical protein